MCVGEGNGRWKCCKESKQVGNPICKDLEELRNPKVTNATIIKAKYGLLQRGSSVIVKPPIVRNMESGEDFETQKLKIEKTDSTGTLLLHA